MSVCQIAISIWGLIKRIRCAAFTPPGTLGETQRDKVSTADSALVKRREEKRGEGVGGGWFCRSKQVCLTRRLGIEIRHFLGDSIVPKVKKFKNMGLKWHWWEDKFPWNQKCTFFLSSWGTKDFAHFPSYFPPTKAPYQAFSFENGRISLWHTDHTRNPNK